MGGRFVGAAEFGDDRAEAGQRRGGGEEEDGDPSFVLARRLAPHPVDVRRRHDPEGEDEVEADPDVQPNSTRVAPWKLAGHNAATAMPTSAERKSRGRMRMIRSARRNGLCFTVVAGIVAPARLKGPHHIVSAAVHPNSASPDWP